MRSESGFTLIETVVAAAVLVAGLTTLLGLLDSSVKASLATHQREQATSLARQVLEDARGLPYAQLDPQSTASQLQAMPNLKNEGTGWQVLRGGTTYTIAVKECSIDDGKGGIWGKHVNSFGENPFCKDPEEKEYAGEAGGPDTQPEDLKRITVDVTWTARGRTPDVRQVETVSAAGASPGLIATNLKLKAPAPDAGTPERPVIGNPNATLLTFSVSSPTGTRAMRWSLEGVAQATAPTLEEGTTWTFSWSIPNPGVSDGTYTVAVQAIDKRGVLGPPVSIPVTLVRNVPVAPSGLKGGYNKINVLGVPKQVVELEWKPNAERNVIGYRIRRNGTLVCPGELTTLSTSTACLDETPPKPATSTAAERTYSAVALYRNVKSEVAEGNVATFTILGGPPPQPHQPKGLKLTHNAEGAVVLSWEAPESGGEPVIFYRIYRGSTNYSSRYDVTTETKYIDTDAIEAHKYWVTAVDPNLTESVFEGFVEG